MSERHSGHERVEGDFYVEEPWAAAALFRAESFIGTVLDPACGIGTIIRGAQAAGLPASGSDLHDRGAGRPGLDFLSDSYPLRTDNIVTNPPFSLAMQFARRALEVVDHKIALLVRLNFLASARRRLFFEHSPLARVLVFSDRIRVAPAGQELGNNPSVDHCWIIWNHGHQGPPTLGWLHRKDRT